MQTPGEQSVSRKRQFADFFGLKRNLVILLIAIFVIGAGEELWMRFVPKYLQGVGATVFVIGLYDALRTLLGAIYAYPGGVFVDLWGHRRAFIIFNLVSIAGYVFASRSCTRSKSPLHGCRRSIRHQTAPHHDCAIFRWDVDRPFRNHQR